MNYIDTLKNQVDSVKPVLLQKVQDTLKTLYPNVSGNIINNIMLERIAQMFTTKWIMLENSSGKIIPNWYSLVFLKSGGGKDRLVNDIDKFVMNDFIDYYKTMSKSIYQEQQNGEKDTSSIINAQNRLLARNEGGNDDFTNGCAF